MSSCIIWIALLCSLFGTILCQAEGDDQKRINKTMDGKYLLDMGSKLRSPMLRLIAKTLISTECRYHSCTEWSMWNNCPVHYKEDFGLRTRTRNCSRKSDMCAKMNKDSNTKMEEETKRCEGFCPHHYTFTKNGYCLKYIETKENHSTAETVCQGDGGHLVNVNTPHKRDAIQILLKSGNAWIDGKRKDINSPWAYSYETGPVDGFSNWHPNHPTSNSNWLCLGVAITSNVRKWFDYICATKYQFVCEIKPY